MKFWKPGGRPLILLYCSTNRKLSIDTVRKRKGNMVQRKMSMTAPKNSSILHFLTLSFFQDSNSKSKFKSRTTE